MAAIINKAQSQTSNSNAFHDLVSLENINTFSRGSHFTQDNLAFLNSLDAEKASFFARCFKNVFSTRDDFQSKIAHLQFYLLPESNIFKILDETSLLKNQSADSTNSSNINW